MQCNAQQSPVIIGRVCQACKLAIDWDYLIVETILLAAVVFGAIYVENWLENRKRHRDDGKKLVETLRYVRTDLENKLRFIDDTISFKDYKPFFTDIWDAIILDGRQSLMQFELFKKLQHTYSWMKYYNTELDQRQKTESDSQILDTIGEVRKSIEESISLLTRTNLT